jgi:hypothetical protein
MYISIGSGHNGCIEYRPVPGIHQLEKLTEHIPHIGTTPERNVDDIRHEPVIIDSSGKFQGIVADCTVGQKFLIHMVLRYEAVIQ